MNESLYKGGDHGDSGRVDGEWANRGPSAETESYPRFRALFQVHGAHGYRTGIRLHAG